MAPREGCPLRSGDWCSRLSWPGTPVTSFRWGRVVTITVSPGGAASPAREDAPRCRRPAVLRADNRPQGPSRTHPIPTRSLRADSRLLDPSPAHPDIVPPRLTLGHLTLGTVTGAPHRCPVTPCLGVADPRGPSRTHLAVVLQRLVRATGPKFRRGHVPVAPCVRTAEPARRRERTSDGEYGPRGRRPRAFRCVLASRAPRPARLPPPTGTFHAAGCVSFRAGAFDAVGDSNPVPARAGCPRPHRNVPARAGRPQPRRLSAGPPWHPEPLVRQLHQRRRPTTTSGPHTDARSGQAEEGATGSKRGSSQT